MDEYEWKNILTSAGVYLRRMASGAISVGFMKSSSISFSAVIMAKKNTCLGGLSWLGSGTTCHEDFFLFLIVL